MPSSREAEVSIRAVTDADAEAIAAFFAAAHAQDPVLGMIGAEDWRRFAAQSQNRGGRDFRVAEDASGIVGVAMPSLRDHAVPAIRHFRIVVVPERRRAGIGSALLRHLAEMDAEPALLQCLCPEGWEALADFLAARGFAVLEHELDMMRDAEGEAPRQRDVAIREVADAAPLAEALATIHNRAYAGTPSFVRLDGAGMRELLAGAALFVAEVRGAPVGFCHVELGRPESRIESVAVAPDRQGRGVGTALIAAALQAAAARAGPRLRLSVSDRNAAGYALYRRLGFQVIAKSARYRAERAKVLAALEGGGR